MSVSAAQVKELRERTGAGMMECKKALLATKGDMEGAIEELRKSGRARADKKAGRVAAEGVVIIRSDSHGTLMVELNSETDFVARDENFLQFANAVAETALADSSIPDVETLSQKTLKGATISVDEARQVLVAKVGENVTLRRLVRIASDVSKTGVYLHGSRIGVLVELDVDHPELAKDIAMHVAASRPLVILPGEVPAAIVDKEREIFMAQAAASGKPQQIMEKMVEGRIRKFLDEISLVGQPFVRDPEMTVGKLLEKHRARVVHFSRFEVGEGIEKEADDFVGAVMAQVHGG